jgi:hypothetical protein
MFGSQFGFGTPLYFNPLHSWQIQPRKADSPNLLDMSNTDGLDYADLEKGDRIFTAHIFPEDQRHFICAASTVSQCLVEAFSKNSETSSF